MPNSNDPTLPIRHNPGPCVAPEDDLPVFHDTCRERDTTNNPNPNPNNNNNSSSPRVIEGDYTAIDTSTTTTTLEAQPPRNPNPAPIDLPSTIAGPVRNIQYSQIKDRKSLLEQLSKTIPINPYGLPEFLYRPDLLDPQHFDHYPTVSEARQLQDELGSAILTLNYGEGYPSLPSGMPLWSRFEWENDDGYNIFTEYLEQPGARSLHMLQGVDLELSLEWFTLNYWSWRAKSFDLYQAAHEQRLRVRRILSTEGSHYDLADKLLKQVRSRINTFNEEDLEQIDPMTAVNMMEKLVRVQRVSLGLPANGSTDETRVGIRTPLPIDQQMRRLTKDAVYDEQRRQDDTDIDILRDSPEALEMAQDLILKLGKSKGKGDK
jgi:hypothetical protein